VGLVVFLFAAILDGTARAIGWYATHTVIDVPIHFAWSMALAIILFLYFELDARDVFEVMIIGNILFEVGEMIHDKIIPQPPHHIDIFFWDGFSDILIGMIGVTVGWIIFQHTIKQPLTLRYANIKKLFLQKR